MTDTDAPTEWAIAYLKRSDRIYKSMLRDARGRQAASLDRRLAILRDAALLSAIGHTGRYADGALDNLLLGGDLRTESKPLAGLRKVSGRRHLLHIATKLYAVGGHSRFLNCWIRLDAQSCHSLLVSDPRSAIPSWSLESVQNSGGDLLQSPSGLNEAQRISWLRNAARRNYDAIVLHHHPHDVASVAALAADDMPPVAVLNHSDHTFWTGSSVADVTISFRRWGQQLAATRRFSRLDALLPIPLVRRREHLSKEEARRTLGISPSEMVLLTIGAPEKYSPVGRHNFMKVASRIVNDSPQARIFVIGPTVNDVRAPIPDRVHVMGRIADPSSYQAAADIYLEGFPEGSLTALLETSAFGAHPILMFAPIPQHAIGEDVALEGLVHNAPNEDEYCEQVRNAVERRKSSEELGRQVQLRIHDLHAGEGWLSRLYGVYSTLSSTNHAPGPIPETLCEAEQADVERARVCHARVGDAPLLSAVAGHGTSAGDLLGTLSRSIRYGDTMASAQHAKTWLTLLSLMSLTRMAPQAQRVKKMERAVRAAIAKRSSTGEAK